MQTESLSFEQMSSIQGGYTMPCWMAVGLALGTAAVGGAGCAASLGAACVGGVIGSVYAYEHAVDTCGW